MDLGLRIYAELPDVAAGEALADQVIALLPGSARVLAREVKPYWKIPEHQGIWLRLAAVDLIVTFDAVMAALAASWDVHCEGKERWAVWNHYHDGPGVLPPLRWMNLEPL